MYATCKGRCRQTRFLEYFKIPKSTTWPHQYRTRCTAKEFNVGYTVCRQCDLVFPPPPVRNCPCCNSRTSANPMKKSSKKANTDKDKYLIQEVART